MLLGLTTDLLHKGLDLLCITAQKAPLSFNDELGLMLQLEQVLGVACHVRPTTMVVVLKGIARLIHACLPLRVRAVLDRIQRDGCARSEFDTIPLPLLSFIGYSLSHQCSYIRWPTQGTTMPMPRTTIGRTSRTPPTRRRPLRLLLNKC
jgi:hypothetical protein